MSTDSIENVQPGDKLFVEAAERSCISRVSRVTKTLVFMEDSTCFSRSGGYLARNSVNYARAYVRPVRPGDEERLAAERRHRELVDAVKKLSPCNLTDVQMERILEIADGETAYSDASAPQWIPVEERLPEDDRYFYLVADARMIPLGVDCAEYTCETKLFSRDGSVLHPTHWCAIPPRPEKVREKC